MLALPMIIGKTSLITSASVMASSFLRLKCTNSSRENFEGDRDARGCPSLSIISSKLTSSTSLYPGGYTPLSISSCSNAASLEENVIGFVFEFRALDRLVRLRFELILTCVSGSGYCKRLAYLLHSIAKTELTPRMLRRSGPPRRAKR
jgi:hypothetical protein